MMAESQNPKFLPRLTKATLVHLLVLFSLGCSTPKATIIVANYTGDEVTIICPPEKSFTLRHKGEKELRLPAGSQKVTARKKDGTTIEDFSETTMAEAHYFYKVKGKGWAALINCNNLYSSGSGRAQVEVTYSKSPSSTPGRVYLQKPLDDRWNTLGGYDSSRDTLNPASQGLPREKPSDGSVYILMHTVKGGPKYLKRALRSMM